MNTRKQTTLAILLSMSIVVSIVEASLIPLLSISVPGAKLGLANVVTIVIMYHYSEKDAFTILMLRIILVGVLRGTMFNYPFWLSLSGGLLAFGLMYLFKKLKVFNMVSVSIMGSIGHATGQILMAIILLDTAELGFYLPVLFLISLPTGLFVGWTSNIALQNLSQAQDIEGL
jgi:heptaprenyl diphosphate synthase